MCGQTPGDRSGTTEGLDERRPNSGIDDFEIRLINERGIELAGDAEARGIDGARAGLRAIPEPENKAVVPELGNKIDLSRVALRLDVDKKRKVAVEVPSEI
jgi:hypothetical protein